MKELALVPFIPHRISSHHPRWAHFGTPAFAPLKSSPTLGLSLPTGLLCALLVFCSEMVWHVLSQISGLPLPNWISFGTCLLNTDLGIQDILSSVETKPFTNTLMPALFFWPKRHPIPPTPGWSSPAIVLMVGTLNHFVCSWVR